MSADGVTLEETLFELICEFRDACDSPEELEALADVIEGHAIETRKRADRKRREWRDAK